MGETVIWRMKLQCTLRLIIIIIIYVACRSRGKGKRRGGKVGYEGEGRVRGGI